MRDLLFVTWEGPELAQLVGSATFLRNVGSYRRHALPNISEDRIFHNHLRKNLKSYIALTGWTL
jgi:hypothetical protein